ncbi:MAG: class GN sortase [Sphingobium sp.]
MIAAVAMKGGRAFGRVLPTILLTALCLLGLTLMARGAIIPVKAWAAQILLDRAFDQSLARHQPVKPWPWADTAPAARIAVPRLGVSQVVLSGGSGQAMAFGPTVMPGKPPVTIMAAHRDTHFAFLKSLRPGDRVEVQSIHGKVDRYEVTGTGIVRWDRFAYPAHPARPLLALTTCYPFDAVEHGPLRYVVWAQRTTL